MNKPINSTSHNKKRFYDVDQILSIPILDVCAHFGIRIKYKGKDPWCSIRPADKTPSAILHANPSSRHKINTYCDFGAGNEIGNNIDLACHMLGLNRKNKADWYAAMEHLAQAFHISPVNSREVHSDELTDREWALLGLYGDRATKNFTFDYEHMSVDQIRAISKKYGMSMNELKKSHLHTYERLLKTRAIPHLQEARNNYYMQLWMSRNNLRSVLGHDANLVDKVDFENTVYELSSMERVLSRAMQGTSLTPLKKQEYSPDLVLSRIDAGELKPNFGTKTYNQMNRLAQINKSTVKYRTLNLSRILYEGPDLFLDIPFSAFLKNGDAVVGYLEKDEQTLRPIFEALSTTKQPLSATLQNAKARQAHSVVQASPKANVQMR